MVHNFTSFHIQSNENENGKHFSEIIVKILKCLQECYQKYNIYIYPFSAVKTDYFYLLNYVHQLCIEI